MTSLFIRKEFLVDEGSISINLVKFSVDILILRQKSTSHQHVPLYDFLLAFIIRRFAFGFGQTHFCAKSGLGLINPTNLVACSLVELNGLLGRTSRLHLFQGIYYVMIESSVVICVIKQHLRGPEIERCLRDTNLQCFR